MKQYYKIIIWGCLLELATMPLRAISFMLCAVVTFILFFLFVNILIKKYSGKLKPEYIFISIFVGCSLFQVPLRIWLPDTSVSLPDFLFHLLGIIMGYLFYKSTQIAKITVLIFSLASCIFLYFKGYDMWLHKLNFGTFTGKIEATLPSFFQFVNEQGDTLSLNNFSGKYTVIDFWYTGCGVCFQKFPKVQALYDEYKDNPLLAVISMNALLKNETESLAFETIKSKGYSFPVYCLNMGDPVLSELDIDGYPTVLIFDKGGKAIFRGSIENASDYMDKLIHK
ncbi:MAG: TlpA family protein disulfide reductase [Bacteroidales bacterium]|jgi:thiol-disulfide isomerase/thioredoxin|nr:TlpA family protein disulfide reductase [Bacteroidales bacterium]